MLSVHRDNKAAWIFVMGIAKTASFAAALECGNAKVPNFIRYPEDQ